MYYGWPQKGEIRFDNVSIRYGIQCDSVIKTLQLCIPAGQKVLRLQLLLLIFYEF